MGEIRRGHVVLFVRDGRFFVHRVVGKIRREDRTLLVTRGDRLKENDPPVFRRRSCLAALPASFAAPGVWSRGSRSGAA